MNIDISFLEKDLIDNTISKPLSGTLSGHAAGEPFDKHVYQKIKEKFPGKTFKQYEYLNSLYLNNQDQITSEERHNLVKYPAVRFLISRGVKTTEKWSSNNLFEEKQNDTADILVVEKSFFNIIDVKTENLKLKGQPPNIISAYKLAKMCGIMLKENDLYNHDITYIGLGWELEGKELKCKEVSIKGLFKSNPKDLYINWAAALQIQFYVKELDQDYKKDVKSWCIEYLRVFIKQAEKRRGVMNEKFIEPFKELLK